MMRSEKTKIFINKLSVEKPFFFNILASLVASVLFAIGTYFIKIPHILCISIVNQSDNNISQNEIYSLSIKLWIFIILIFFIFSLLFFMGRYTGGKRNRESEYNATILQLTDELTAAQENYNSELDKQTQKISEYEEWNNLCNKLYDYTNKSEVVESIQLFSYSPISDICASDSKNDIEISFHFEGGCAKKKSNVNVLYNMNYQFGYTIYESLSHLFKRRNDYYSQDYSHKADKTTEKNIQTEAINVFNEITDLLNEIKEVSQIKDIHYAYYRMLEILSNVVLSPTKAVECKELLVVDSTIEKQLKTGQRTGMLGTLFTESTYSFCNENSSVKKNRSYFTTPLNYKGKNFILLVILERDKLRLHPNDHDDIKCCEKIYDEIAAILKSKVA